MKFISIVFILQLIISCTNKELVNSGLYIKREFKLMDRQTDEPFAVVKLLLPQKYDTLSIWDNYGSDDGCGPRNYRYTNSRSCRIKNNGTLNYDGCRDSIDEIKIMHSCRIKDYCIYVNLNMNDLNEKISHSMRRAEYTGNPPLVIWKVKTLKLINGRKFQVTEDRTYGCDHNFPSESIFASTVINNTWIYFSITCNQENCENFSAGANQILNSLEIVTNLK